MYFQAAAFWASDQKQEFDPHEKASAGSAPEQPFLVPFRLYN
jgi:hypothetical protein